MASYGTDNKKELIKKYRLSDSDTGSIQLQIALLTHRINYLVSHLKKHHKDNHTRTGLLALVGRRKRFISYLKTEDYDGYVDLSKKLKLKVK
ncbi:30S ribosomal protein S15 [Candidatus Marinamargulisbacteria bacterium SCGC AG-343-D04]|nr:30S ribosomal protein S15 [Candidatus Marinamargulisbacteria bacterium SCGC AG-343-D04]